MKKRAGIVAAVLIVALLLPVVTVTTACDNAPKDYMAQIDSNAEQVKVDLPFSKGVNFSAWFEKTSADQIDMTYYTEQDAQKNRCPETTLKIWAWTLCACR